MGIIEEGPSFDRGIVMTTFISDLWSTEFEEDLTSFVRYKAFTQLEN